MGLYFLAFLHLFFTNSPCAFADVVFSKSEPMNVSLVYQKSSLSVSACFSDPDRYMDAGQEASIFVEISNLGAGKAYNVTGYIYGELQKELTIEQRASVGIIPPGGKRLITFNLKASEQLPEHIIPLSLAVTEKFGLFPATIDITLSCRANKNNTALKPTTIKTSMHSISIDNDIPSAGRVDSSAVAVIIGNSDYEFSSFGPVEYAHNDARTMREYLIRIFGYDPEKIFIYQNAASGAFHEIFGTVTGPGELAHYVTSDTTDVFVYYSGHGSADLETMTPYFVPVDCGFSPDNLRKKGYPVDLLLNNLAELSAHSITLVIDTSFKGISETGTVSLDCTDLGAYPENIVLFTATSKKGTPNRFHESMHGLFTYVFLKSIKDMILQGKKTITAGDIFTRVSDENGGVPYLDHRIFRGQQQYPLFLGNPGQVLIEVE